MKPMTKHNDICGGVWVFGDYRNYFENRVTLQLIAKARALAEKMGCETAVAVLGDDVSQFAMEYVAHGADIVVVGEHPDLKDYRVDAYTDILSEWVRFFKPKVFLAGATTFGKEFFPRLAKRLNTGLSADCVALEIDESSGLLIQTTPAWGGELLADIVTAERRPQMATVHPGIFSERPHDRAAVGRVIYPEIKRVAEARIEIIRSRRQKPGEIKLEDSRVVVAGGMGLGSRENFQKLFELAELLGAEVGATRPAVSAGWADQDRMLGQTGKAVKPKLLITVGTSGALQYVTGIQGAETIVAVNRDPDARIFSIADVGIVGDAADIVPRLIDSLKKRKGL
jgi:electron transfer flavoprotein alpha subunit